MLCQKCGIILNLPDSIAAGKRVKCPRCGHKFVISQKDASSESTVAGPADADLMSSREFGKRPPSHDDLPVPVGERDLREMFDLPMGTAQSIEKSMVSGQKPVVSDAEALFQDDASARRRKKTARKPVPRRGAAFVAGALSPWGCRSARPAASTRTPACASAWMTTT